MIRSVIVVFPEPVPPQMPIMSELALPNASRVVSGVSLFLVRYVFLRALSSSTACAAAKRATGTRNGDALT